MFKYVRIYSNMLEYVRDWFVTCDQLNLWHDYLYHNNDRFISLYHNNDRFIKWRNGYKKRKTQEASIKEELMPSAWHPSRWWDWCVPEDEKKETENFFLTTSFAEIKNVQPKTLMHQKQVNDIFLIDVNKVIVSDKVSCNNRKDCRYILGYQVDGRLIPLFIKTPKNIFSYGVSQYDKNSAYTMSFNVSEEKAWVSQYR